MNREGAIMKEVSIEEIVLQDKYQCIDVRSPAEFEESHIPNALHLPLFTDAEREEIGTIYKQQGTTQAKWKAMEVVAPKIPAMMHQLREVIQQGKEPVIYCWRGGMRSKSVALFASLTGLSVARLIGGYKSYRHYILEQMKDDSLHALTLPKMIVFHGMTGIGKTELLLRLAERGWPVLNLEQLANHRGSVFGAFGHWQAHNQKTFDSLLFDRLMKLRNQPIVLIEAESKRIGKVVLPEFIMEAKEKGLHLLLTAEMPVRVERIYDEYVKPYVHAPWFVDKVNAALTVIQKRMSNELRSHIKQALENKDYYSFIKLILENYYDPMYAHKQDEYAANMQVIDISNLDKGLHKIEELLQQNLALASTS